jgi:hypothetical protein
MNPPFSSIQKWMRKAFESVKLGAVVVALIPARTDTQWFRDCGDQVEDRGGAVIGMDTFLVEEQPDVVIP